MNINQKLRVLEHAKREGATDEQLMRICSILFPESTSSIGPKTRKAIESYIKEYDSGEKVEKFDLETVVSDTLHEIGVPASLLGYKYLRTAIIWCVEDESLAHSVTKRLYPRIAEEFGTTSSRAERSLRHAVEVAWERGNAEVLHKYFGYTVDGNKGKPTTREFVAMVTDYLKLKYKL